MYICIYVCVHLVFAFLSLVTLTVCCKVSLSSFTFVPWSKISWTYLWKSFSGLSTLSHWYMSLPPSIPHCLYYYNFVVSVNIKKCDSSHCIKSFSLGACVFPHKFRMSLSMSTRHFCWDFDRMCIQGELKSYPCWSFWFMISVCLSIYLDLFFTFLSAFLT